MTPGCLTSIIGNSAAMQHLRAMITMAAPSQLPVLIQGPTGAGKELVAAALHGSSARKGRLVAFNVCAIGDSMFEDALFGHTRGAFTGAVADAHGFLREADQGTVFFDEIGGLPLALQAKLLRALETQVFRPVGARFDVRSTFRLVAATNEPLDAMVRDGRFRADLSHRIGAVVIQVPPLASRREDIQSLVAHFCGVASANTARVDGDAIDVLERHSWPGNIRELKQVVEWSLVLGHGHLTLGAVTVALGQRATSPAADPDSEEYVTLRALLDANDWDMLRVARELGVHRATLYRMMKRHRIRMIRKVTCDVAAPIATTRLAAAASSR